MTSVEFLLLITALASIVVALVLLHRHHQRKLAALAGDLGVDELRSDAVYEQELDGQKYRFGYLAGNKNRASQFKVSVDCVSKGGFRIARETRWDAFAKRLGIAAEIQTGDADFDAACYIHTNNIAFTKTFFRSVDRRQALSQLFLLKYKHFEHDGATMVAVLRPFNPSDGFDKTTLGSVVKALAVLARDPPTDFFELLVAGRPAWKIKRVVVFVVSIMAFLTGLVLTPWASGDFPPLDKGAVFEASLQYSGPALLGFVIASIAMLKGRSSSHNELALNLVFAVIGFPLLGYGAFIAVNGMLDDGQPDVHRVEILDKHITKSGNSKSRFIYVKSWREGSNQERIGVGRTVYARMSIGSTLRVTTLPGRLGFEWIVDYQQETD